MSGRQQAAQSSAPGRAARAWWSDYLSYRHAASPRIVAGAGGDGNPQAGDVRPCCFWVPQAHHRRAPLCADGWLADAPRDMALENLVVKD